MGVGVGVGARGGGGAREGEGGGAPCVVGCSIDIVGVVVVVRVRVGFVGVVVGRVDVWVCRRVGRVQVLVRAAVCVCVAEAAAVAAGDGVVRGEGLVVEVEGDLRVYVYHFAFFRAHDSPKPLLHPLLVEVRHIRVGDAGLDGGRDEQRRLIGQAGVVRPAVLGARIVGVAAATAAEVCAHELQRHRPSVFLI